MHMQTEIIEFEGQAVIVLPQEIVDELDIKVGQSVELTVEHNPTRCVIKLFND